MKKAGAAALGREGEEAAAALLASEGWSIIERNWRAWPGEIDLIALRDGILAFVEVKSWSVFGPGDLADSVGQDKRRRIVETAQIFLARHREYSNVGIRFDLMLMREGRIERRIESAFTGEL